MGKPSAKQRPRPTRVCFVSAYAYGVLRPERGLPVGGAEIQICTLARELARDARFQIFVLTANERQQAEESIDSIRVVTYPVWGDRPTDIARTAGKTPTVAPRSSPLRIFKLLLQHRYFLPVVRARRWVAQTRHVRRRIAMWTNLFRRIDADIYVARCASPHVGFAQAAARRLGKRFVYMVAHEDEVSGAYIARESEGAWFDRALHGADIVICQHGEQLAAFHARYKTAARYIPSLLPFRIGGPPGADRETILWISRLDSWKRPEVILELARRVPEEQFVIVGRQSETDPTDPALFERLTSLPNVRWIERVSFEKTYDLFDEAKVFVNTSNKEGFPNTFMQAAARGTPILSWSVNPDGVLERFAIGYCSNENWKEFVNHLRTIASDPVLRDRLGESGRHYARAQHDAGVIASQYAELFLTLLQRAPVRAATPVTVPSQAAVAK